MTSKSVTIVLHEGDTYQFLKDLPENIITLAITSPSYHLGKVYEKRVGIEKYLKDQEKVIREMVRIFKNDKSIYLLL